MVKVTVVTKGGKKVEIVKEVSPWSGTVQVGWMIIPVKEIAQWIKTMYSDVEKVEVVVEKEEEKRISKKEFVSILKGIIKRWSGKRFGEYYFEGEVRNEAAWVFAGRDFRSVETYLIILQFDNEKYEIEVAAEKAIDGPHQEILRVIKENGIKYVINRF